jgi:hypothetical protein
MNDDHAQPETIEPSLRFGDDLVDGCFAGDGLVGGRSAASALLVSPSATGGLVASRSAADVVAATLESVDELLARLRAIAPERSVLEARGSGTRDVEPQRPLSHLSWDVRKEAGRPSDRPRGRTWMRTAREQPTSRERCTSASVIAQRHRTPNRPRSARSTCRSRRAARYEVRSPVARPTGRRSTPSIGAKSIPIQKDIRDKSA